MADYYCIVTDIGAAKLTNSLVLGVPVILTHMAVGDGNGVVYNPLGSATALAREVHRAPLNAVLQDPNNANWLICECVLPAAVGGWMIREAGLIDDDGDLIAIAKVPESYKAALESGSANDLYLRLVLQHTNVSQVQLKVDPSIVLATRAYVQDRVAAHAGSRDHPYATHEARGFVELATPAEAAAMADPTRAVTPEGLGAAIAGAVERVPLAALDYPTVVTADHRVAVTAAAVAGTGGTVSIPGGISIIIGEAVGDGTGRLRTVTTAAWTSSALAANATYYLRARLVAGALEVYVQQGTDADAVPGGLTGTPGDAAGGGFDSTRIDALLARIYTGAVGSTPTVTGLANAARLHLAGSVSVGLSPLLSWTSNSTAALPLNWGRRPTVCSPSIQFIGADSSAPWGVDLTSSGSGALQMIGVRSASVSQSRYSTGPVEIAYDDTANNGGVVHIAWLVEA